MKHLEVKHTYEFSRRNIQALQETIIKYCDNLEYIDIKPGDSYNFEVEQQIYNIRDIIQVIRDKMTNLK
jgi:hypothetical protein